MGVPGSRVGVGGRGGGCLSYSKQSIHKAMYTG